MYQIICVHSWIDPRSAFGLDSEEKFSKSTFFLFFFQVKKASRWSCKLCGEKQSLLKVHLLLSLFVNPSFIPG